MERLANSEDGEDVTKRPCKLLALVPWLAFLAATMTADAFIERTTVSPAGLASFAASSLAFVALPSLAPIAAARSSAVGWAAAAVMTVVAAIAGVLVVATDDAQAGLAVLWVPYVALPLALVISVTEAVVRKLRSRS